MNEIYLYGTVGESFWGEECFTPSMVRDQLATMSGPITVRINSGGGIAVDGQTIYNLLRDHAGAKTVIIDGVAASAASLIAMAGDTVKMRDGSILMIHDPAWPFTDGRGTEADHLRAAKTLGIVSNAYAKVYAKFAGITPEASREIMRSEVYFDCEAALAAGFTHVIEDEVAQDVAAFDYSLYAHAPKELLAAGALRTTPQTRSRKAVMAMIMGITPTGKGAIKMTKKTTAAAPEDEDQMEEEDDLTSEDQTDEDIAAEDEEDDIEAQDDDDGIEAEGDDDDDEDEPAPKAKVKASDRHIINLCAKLRRSASEAQSMIKRKLTLKQAATEIKAKLAKEVPVTATLRQGGPSARITRDERDTRRKGMTGAIVAQMARDRAVTGPARDYMDMGLAHMAAECVGHKGALRRGGSEVRVLEMALGSSSTSDFPAIFENALNKRLMAAYQVQEPTYRKISTRMDFTDFRPHPISGIGDLAGLLPVGETGEIKSGSTSDKKEMVVAQALGRQFRITRQMMINDDLGAIETLLTRRGIMVAASEDAIFYNMMLSGANADGPTLIETGRQMFNPTDQTKAGTAAAIMVASLSVGRAAMRRRKGVAATAADQVDLDIPPAILLVGPDKETEADQLITNITPNVATAVNPFAGRLEIVVSNKIAGNAWYLFANPAMAPVLMYGYLAGEEGPRMRMDEPFGSQGMAYSVELDFGVGAIDYRGAYKNAGA